MLVLLSFVMVLVATVLLVLGLLVSDGINLIYVSIGMSAVAAVLLVIAVRMSKPSGVAAAGPAPLEPEAEPERELVGVGAASASAGSASTPAPAAVSASDDWLASGDEWGSSGDAEFPIADYDDLTVDEVLGLLPQLYSDELDVVEARERRGLNRTPVIDRLAELRRTGTDADRSTEDEAAESDGGWERGGAVPIAGYDGLAVSEIIGALGGLNDAELAEVRNHESAGKNRRTIVAAIDRRLGGAPAPRRAAPRAAAAAKKAPAKKAATRKAAPARKAAAPARKAAAPARKAAAPARKAPAKKAAAAPARKAAPAKKAPAKKAAAPAKKAAKKR